MQVLLTGIRVGRERDRIKEGKEGERDRQGERNRGRERERYIER